MTYRAVPMIRPELDKQLTNMVLLEVIAGVFTILPYTTFSGVISNTLVLTDPRVKAKFQYVQNMSLLVYHTYFAVSILYSSMNIV